MARIEYELSAHATKRIHSRKIELQWIESALTSPDRIDSDPHDAQTRHALKRISQKDDRVLRVVYNANTKPVRIISVHFDRRLKGKL